MRIQEILEGKVYAPDEAREMRYAVRKKYHASSDHAPKKTSYTERQKLAITMALSDHPHAKIIGAYLIDYPRTLEIAVISLGTSLLAVFPTGKTTKIAPSWKPAFEDFGLTRMQADAAYRKLHPSWQTANH